MTWLFAPSSSWTAVAAAASRGRSIIGSAAGANPERNPRIGGYSLERGALSGRASQTAAPRNRRNALSGFGTPAGHNFRAPNSLGRTRREAGRKAQKDLGGGGAGRAGPACAARAGPRRLGAHAAFPGENCRGAGLLARLQAVPAPGDVRAARPPAVYLGTPSRAARAARPTAIGRRRAILVERSSAARARSSAIPRAPRRIATASAGGAVFTGLGFDACSRPLDDDDGGLGGARPTGRSASTSAASTGPARSRT